jgi:5-methylthioribose kinase
MSRFDTYFLMKESDIPGFVMEKTSGFFDENAVFSVKEIGDGNINYVFHIKDKSGKSLIVKQAGEQLRISPDFNISTDRNRIESEILILQNTYAPGLVPKIYSYDTVMCACIMEDLSDYCLMRHGLIEHKIFPHFADDITTYLVNTSLPTTDVVMDHKEKKTLVRTFINPELCEITEDLVFTEPYNDIKKRNIIIPENAEFVRGELYEDKKLHLEITELKFDFMNNPQALIHGDLHTGSIFVKENREDERAATRIFDPEFAFFGPIGYDVGNIIANLFFAWDNGKVSNDGPFRAWIMETAASVIDLFKEKFLSAFNRKAVEVMAKTEGFAGFYLDTIIADTSAYTGTELIRRTVGMAPVKDLTVIDDEKERAKVSRLNIIAAKKFIFDQRNIHSGKDFVEVFLDSAKKAGV